MPYKANEPRRHKIPKARYKIENWGYILEFCDFLR
jgi:hypothetical protein